MRTIPELAAFGSTNARTPFVSVAVTLSASMLVGSPTTRGISSEAVSEYAGRADRVPAQVGGSGPAFRQGGWL